MRDDGGGSVLTPLPAESWIYRTGSKGYDAALVDGHWAATMKLSTRSAVRSSRTIFNAGSRRFTMLNNIARYGLGGSAKASIAAI